MTVDRAALLKDLQAELQPLIDDLRERCESNPEVDEPVRAEWHAAQTAGRTARSYKVWRDDRLTDVAVAWLLAGVFVRFCEDNGLLDPPLLGGPGDRLEVARGHRTMHFREHPGDGDREWLIEVFTRARAHPGLRDVFGDHSPLWLLGPTADGARRLISFWEQPGRTAGEVHDFTDPMLDTRFLGDLYQDLSESAKKQYALLQTPIFVEEFILDRTLDPAIAEFGLDEVSVIDPTCGSGHFLLGSFDRLLRRWREREPGERPQVLAQRVLDAIAGVDLNPAAVAIARFRLLVAALAATGTKRLADLPDFHLNLAVGDSLLHGRIPGDRLDIAGSDTNVLYQHGYASEDVEEAKRILFRRYSAVVGNPPYITVKDPAMRDAYRDVFKSCRGRYALSVPFFERFFDLAEPGSSDRRAGFVGKITSNSFMKREMGKTLVETYLPTWDLSHIIDASGAYIPGHGTPTVIVLGRNRRPVSPTVRGVLGKRGEPSRPAEPAKGLVWTSMVNFVDDLGHEDAYVSVVDLERTALASHPWSIGGGGAGELKQLLDDTATKRLGSLISEIGRTCHTGDDDAYFGSESSWKTAGLADLTVPLIEGESVRDFRLGSRGRMLFPYDNQSGDSLTASDERIEERLWGLRTNLRNRLNFGETNEQRGLPWFEYTMFFPARYRTPLSISFAHVATHNHFVLDRGGKVFNRSAPVIKLPADASIEDHLGLLALMNSSTACFWMQQVFHNKGGPGGGSSKDEKWHDFYDHDGTKLKQFPIPAGERPVEHGRLLDSMATEHAALLPEAIAERTTPTQTELIEAQAEAEAIRARMIAVQEELDWVVLHQYGLADETYVGSLDDTPPLQLGERAFEISMARQMVAGELDTTWFVRHGSTPITELPSHWPDEYRELVERRIELIESDRDIGLIERPECKRRWATESWESMQDRALREWLLDRLEAASIWGEPRMLTASRLADLVRSDPDFTQVAELYAGLDVDITDLVTELTGAEAVPFLATWRYTEAGMRTRAEWEATWDLQRREDAGEDVGTIPVPPKYKKSDFRQGTYWSLRGKLDVPKERFISYPGVHRDNDRTPVIGWAGWNHLQRAQALSAWFTDAQDRGADADELVSLLAGLWELCPWLRQWHNDIDPTYGQRLGDFFTSYVQTQAATLGISTADLESWRAPESTRKRRKKAT